MEVGQQVSAAQQLEQQWQQHHEMTRTAMKNDFEIEIILPSDTDIFVSPMLAFLYHRAKGNTQEYNTVSFWMELLRRLFYQNRIYNIAPEFSSDGSLRRVDIVQRALNLNQITLTYQKK
ncbi:hypothetical protein F5X99DRAFT_51198 [Biscogniauxia marginata]|nr:hypothetical protein F5X99DRAFT_51198 [Biscogniauxia marginata]